MAPPHWQGIAPKKHQLGEKGMGGGRCPTPQVKNRYPNLYYYTNTIAVSKLLSHSFDWMNHYVIFSCSTLLYLSNGLKTLCAKLHRIWFGTSKKANWQILIRLHWKHTYKWCKAYNLKPFDALFVSLYVTLRSTPRTLRTCLFSHVPATQHI